MEILRQQVESKTAAAVARELGISGAALSQVLNDKYPASTDNIERKVMALYGSPSGLVTCPELGGIAPEVCAGNFGRAKKIGLRAGNPATMKLHKRCQKCGVRN
jgi:hypothetical protein